jgi:hypothetical protein
MIEQLQKILSEILLKEWEAQGHSMTGKVVKEIEYLSKQTADGLVIEGYMAPYANYQAHGAKWPNKRPPIAPLQRYVQQRMGITDEKKSKSIAFAIAANLVKEGLPTEGGMKYTTTGTRRDFIGEALRKNEDRISEEVSKLAFEQMSIKFDTIIDRWNTELNR